MPSRLVQVSAVALCRQPLQRSMLRDCPHVDIVIKWAVLLKNG
ncbi:MAG TPA: hypothetical protein VEC35_15125 [Noviherbaspirillum sp.]|nr:hypothetical protein [Noviherbaspirillum sp.]